MEPGRWEPTECQAHTPALHQEKHVSGSKKGREAKKPKQEQNKKAKGQTPAPGTIASISGKPGKK